MPSSATSETPAVSEDFRRRAKRDVHSNGPTIDPNLFGYDDPDQDDDIQEIFKQLEPETESMIEDEELMEVQSNRKKRSPGPGRGRGMPNLRRGGFDLEPPVYGRQRNGVLFFQ